MTSTKRYLSLIAFAAACATIPASALAMGQSTTNQGNGGAQYSDMAPSRRPAEFLARFVELTRADLAANAVLLAALGLESDAGTAASQSSGFSVETTTGSIEATVAAAAAAHQQVMARLAARPVLSAEKQAAFAAGALSLVQAINGYAELTKDYASVKKSLADAGAKGRLALYAAKSVPATVAQAREELKAAAQFAESNQIVLAPEVSLAAGAL